MTNERAPWRWAGRFALIGASAGAVMTAMTGRPVADVQDGVLAVLALAWSAAPYLVAYAGCRAMLPSVWAVPSACGIVAYALVDLTAHWQSLYAPGGSTDALALLFLPVWSPVAIGGVATTARAIGRLARHRA